MSGLYYLDSEYVTNPITHRKVKVNSTSYQNYIQQFGPNFFQSPRTPYVYRGQGAISRNYRKSTFVPQTQYYNNNYSHHQPQQYIRQNPQRPSYVASQSTNRNVSVPNVFQTHTQNRPYYNQNQNQGHNEQDEEEEGQNEMQDEEEEEEQNENGEEENENEYENEEQKEYENQGASRPQGYLQSFKKYVKPIQNFLWPANNEYDEYSQPPPGFELVSRYE